MRESVKKSLEDSPDKQFERYPKGSVVLCNACALPIFKLDYGLALGTGVGKSAAAFVPLNLADLDELAGREDIDSGVRVTVRGWDLARRIEHINKLRTCRSGEPMLCPCCGDAFVQVLAITRNEVLDRAYCIEMLTIPPKGAGKPAPVRGKRIGAGPGREWIH